MTKAFLEQGAKGMEPQNMKYHMCPHCKRQAIVLVDINDSAVFHRDDVGNIQYQCIHCFTTFSINANGAIVTIRLLG